MGAAHEKGLWKWQNHNYKWSRTSMLYQTEWQLAVCVLTETRGLEDSSFMIYKMCYLHDKLSQPDRVSVTKTINFCWTLKTFRYTLMLDLKLNKCRSLCCIDFLKMLTTCKMHPGLTNYITKPVVTLFASAEDWRFNLFQWKKRLSIVNTIPNRLMTD